MPEYTVLNGWVVEVVGHHTCGTGPSGHYGLHEPYCGVEPIAPVASLEPLRATVRKVPVAPWVKPWVWLVHDPRDVVLFGFLDGGAASSCGEANDEARAAVIRLMVERSGS